MHAALRVAKPRSFSVEGGELVRLLLPVKGKKLGEITERSLVAVGDEMTHGAIIVNELGKPIPAVRIPVRRYIGGKIEYDIEVFDPGLQYDVCFDADPKTPPQRSMLYKA